MNDTTEISVWTNENYGGHGTKIILEPEPYDGTEKIPNSFLVCEDDDKTDSLALVSDIIVFHDPKSGEGINGLMEEDLIAMVACRYECRKNKTELDTKIMESLFEVLHLLKERRENQ